MNRILVGIDDSPRASFVLETAADLATRTGAKLCLFHSVGLPPVVDQEGLAHATASIVETLTKAAETELKRLAGTLAPGMVEGTYVRVGTPWDAICYEAKLLDCDLVVIGSHGYSGLDKILGTTAAKVVNHCERSVLVVRPKAQDAKP